MGFLSCDMWFIYDCEIIRINEIFVIFISSNEFGVYIHNVWAHENQSENENEQRACNTFLTSFHSACAQTQQAMNLNLNIHKS